MRKQTIDTNSITEMTIQLVADNGLENVSAAKVAARLGISEGSIFHYFSTKHDLLTACFYSIDRQVDDVLHKVPFQGLSFEKNAHALWEAYINYFIAHGNYAKFYLQFRHSAFYTKDVIAGQNKSFSFFTKLIGKNASIFGINTDILWVYIIETSLNFVVRIVDNSLPSGHEDRQAMYNLLFFGISSAFHKGSTAKWPTMILEAESPVSDSAGDTLQP